MNPTWQKYMDFPCFADNLPTASNTTLRPFTAFWPPSSFTEGKIKTFQIKQVFIARFQASAAMYTLL
jgi:hypothetical protein